MGWVRLTVEDSREDCGVGGGGAEYNVEICNC